jgi:hypothetical protein
MVEVDHDLAVLCGAYLVAELFRNLDDDEFDAEGDRRPPYPP